MLSHGSGVSTRCHPAGGLGQQQAPASSGTPNPRVCQHCQNPPFPQGMAGEVFMGSHSAPDTSLLLSHLRSSTWKMTRTGTRLSCSAARALSPKTTSRSSHTRKYRPSSRATIPIPEGLPRARGVPHVGKLSHGAGVCLLGQSASATTAQGDWRQKHTPKIQPSHRAATK